MSELKNFIIQFHRQPFLDPNPWQASILHCPMANYPIINILTDHNTILQSSENESKKRRGEESGSNGSRSEYEKGEKRRDTLTSEAGVEKAVVKWWRH